MIPYFWGVGFFPLLLFIACVQYFIYLYRLVWEPTLHIPLFLWKNIFGGSKCQNLQSLEMEVIQRMETAHVYSTGIRANFYKQATYH